MVHYAKADKLATSVGFYYMSNACGRLLGTLGSGLIYTYAGDNRGEHAGSDARAGLAACFIAGTVSSALAAFITVRIRDDAAGLRCGSCVCVAAGADRGEQKAAAGSKVDLARASSTAAAGASASGGTPADPAGASYLTVCAP